VPDSAGLLGSLAMPLMLLSLGHTVLRMSSTSLGKGSCAGMVRLAIHSSACARHSRMDQQEPGKNSNDEMAIC
jgi:hypothetical protein